MPIRLLQRQSDGNFCLTKPFLGDNTPPYAILSHTWLHDSEEVTYEDLVGNSGRGKAGYAKISFCAEQAANNGLTHFWVDSCCIKKSSDAELSEAINSMFKWYRRAAKCYVYLSDVSASESYAVQESALRGSRWFTRGWTLQELLAPESVEFFSKEGHRLGDRKLFERTIGNITGIPLSALAGAPLSQFTVEERMRWAAGRTTTREEDQAYCLLGIFNVFIPPIYGEGEHAFTRLKEAINKRRKIRSDVPGIDHSQHLFTKEVLLDSLRFDQIDDRFVNIKSGLVKTCKWLLQSTEYLDWLNPEKLSDHHGFFWIKGKPGCGKSTLTKFALLEARKTYCNTTLLSFFFNARGTDLEKNTTGLYRSLLAQLLEKCTGFEQALRFSSIPTQALYDRLKTNREMLEHLFAQTIQTIDQHDVMIFIDALDECDEDEVREMVDFFENLGEDAVSHGRQLRVLFSSRHYPHIEIQPCIEMVLENQRGHLQDIEEYLSGKLRAGEGNQAQQIRKDILERASGIFMWVVLVVQILNKDFARGQAHSARKKLQEIPRDLNELFRSILTRDSEYMDQMKLCLQWVLYARRPMKREELYFAILSGTDPERSFIWDSDAISTEIMDLFILNSSKGLAEVTKSKAPTVQFIHESVRDFLLKNNGLGQLWDDLKINTPGLSHDKLKDSCLNYIESDVTDYLAAQSPATALIGLRKGQANKIRRDIILKFPFLSYAVDHLLFHADSAHAEGVRQEQFMQEFDLRAWVALQNIVENSRTRRLPLYVHLSSALAERNCVSLIGLVTRDLQIVDNYYDGVYGNPFLMAIAHDHYEVLDTLMKCHRHVNPGRRDFPFWAESLIRICIQRRPPPILYRFLSAYKQELILEPEEGQKLLRWALNADNEQLFTLLLNMNNDDSNDYTLEYSDMLRRSAGKGYEPAVMLLLEKGEINAYSQYSGTALSNASGNGHERVVELLLKNGADVNIYATNSSTALQEASTDVKNAQIVKLLLDNGADVNAEATSDASVLGGYYGNALQTASYHNITGEIVNLLLKAGANIEAKGGKYRSALIAASVAGNDEVVQLLLDNGADINAEVGGLGNALQAASAHGREEVVKLLLDNGADVNIIGGKYGSALAALSSQYGRDTDKENIKKMLLDRGAKLPSSL